MSASKVRWGILGTAQIARKNWKAIWHSGNATVVGVASREAARSRHFITECQAEAPMAALPHAFGHYEELLAADDLEAVYIPLPTGLRKEWVLRAAAAGKHIVCEKPCAASLADLREMVEACHRHQVQFMDGVMFMHSQRLLRMREVLEDGQSVGPVRRITAHFSFGAPPEFFTANIRAHSGLEPWGCLGDLGWYCLRFVLWTLGWQMPEQVVGHVLSESGRRDSPAAVPTEFAAELLFADGVSAGFYCSFLAQNQQWAIISGGRGYLRVEDFVLPFAGEESAFEVQQASWRIQGCEFRMESHPRRFNVLEGSHGPTAQEANLFRNFSAQVRSGRLNPLWPEIALRTQAAMGACLDSARQGRPVALAPGI